jgi:chromosome segregation ATPase
VINLETLTNQVNQYNESLNDLQSALFLFKQKNQELHSDLEKTDKKLDDINTRYHKIIFIEETFKQKILTLFDDMQIEVNIDDWINEIECTVTLIRDSIYSDSLELTFVVNFLSELSYEEIQKKINNIAVSVYDFINNPNMQIIDFKIK